MEAASSNQRRNPGIDVLRGLSIVLVVFLHINIRFPILKSDLAEVLPRRLLNMVTQSGYSGVTMFFVISGFLITKHTLCRHGTLTNIDLRAFYGIYLDISRIKTTIDV